MVEGIHKYIKKYQRDRLLNRKDKISEEELTEVLSMAPRVEKIAIKGCKAAHLYYPGCRPQRNGGPCL